MPFNKRSSKSESKTSKTPRETQFAPPTSKSVINKKSKKIEELEDEIRQLRELSGRGPSGLVPGEHEMKALKSLNLNPDGVGGEYEKPICTVVEIDDNGKATVIVSVRRGRVIDKSKVMV